MDDITDRDLVRFVFGQADEELAARIAAEQGADPLLDRRIRLRQALAGTFEPRPPQVENKVAELRSMSRRFQLPTHRILVGIAICALLSGTALGGYLYLTNDRLLVDNFDRGWFDLQKWLPQPEFIKDGGVRAEKGAVRLVNRGYLIPRAEIDGPIELQLEWKWSMLGLKPSYSDSLNIALRASGEVSLSNFNEPADGVWISFNASGGFIEFRGQDPAARALLATHQLQPRVDYPMPADQWHKVRITDDGKTVSVYFAGPQIPQSAWENPVLVYTPKEPPAGKRFAIYNRELVAFPHESFVRNLEVRRLR